MRKIISRIRAKINGRPDIERLTRNGLVLGVGVHIGPYVSLDEAHCWLITIEDEVTLAPDVIILAHDASTKRHRGNTRPGRVKFLTKDIPRRLGIHAVY